MSAAPFAIDVVSDVVCPWCFLGKRRLEQALAARPELPVLVRWRPFQLDPTIPPGGMARNEYITRKFGSSSRLADAHARVGAFGRDEGIDLGFGDNERSPNTPDAHRLIRHATEQGRGEEMVEALFSAYFEQGRDIGDHSVLAELAGSAGLDAATTAWLETDEDAQAVRDEIRMAQELGVQGVPFFIVAGKYALSGAQSAEVIGQVIDKALAEQGS
ncbi:DsbA family oxidoreductase [Nostoc sp. NIES-2111]